MVKRPDFDPSLLFVATADDRPVGAAFGISYSTEGWVEQVAVAPSHRNQGIARALLAVDPSLAERPSVDADGIPVVS